MIPTVIKTDVASISTQIQPTAPVTPITTTLDSKNSSAEFIQEQKYQALVQARLLNGDSQILVASKSLPVSLPENFQPGNKLNSKNFPTEFTQGQKYQALIQARLLNGDSQVLVAGNSLQMRLPENFQPGNKLELVFISNEPELEFLALKDTSSDNEITNTSISTAGRFLSALMQGPLKHTSENTANVVTGHALTSPNPILTNAPTNSTDLPGLLQKAIVQSGLFYESHQSQWIHGKNTLENLQQEPQGKLMLITVDSSTAKAAVIATPLPPEMPVHAQTIPLVQQQLTTLETGHLLWRGEAWPGQPMKWDIYEESQENTTKENDSDQATRWHTQLRLSMPELGDITATIALKTSGINIRLSATRSETASLLKNNQLPLTSGMQSAGLNIQAIEVKHDDSK